MNLFATMLERVRDAAERLAGEGVPPRHVDLGRVTVEPPPDPALGDMTTNAALIWADGTGRPPRELAPILAKALTADPLVARVEIGGPGFANITLRPEVWTRMLRDLLTEPSKCRAVKQNNSFEVSLFGQSPKPEKKADITARRAAAAFHTPGAAALDAAQLTEQSYGNPLFNVQYGHARAHAVYQYARESFPDLPTAPEHGVALWQAATLERLNHTTESALLRLIALFPQVLETAAAQRQPHRLGSYLNTLAGAFHTQLRHGMTTPHLRFISQDDRELTVARLALVEAVVIILGAGLSQLGFEAPNEIT